MPIQLQGAKQQPAQLKGTQRTPAAIALEDWSGVWAFNSGEIIGWYFDSQYKLRGSTRPRIKLDGTAT